MSIANATVDKYRNIGATILIVDNDQIACAAIAAALSLRGAVVLQTATVREGLALVASREPDLVILDLEHPDGVGSAGCRDLRLCTTVPLIVLTSEKSEAEKVELLALGADDCVCKPIGIAELTARIEAQLRRARAPRRKPRAVIETDGLTIDLPNRLVRRGDTIIRLSPTEWSILEQLAIHVGSPVRLQDLFDAVWGRDAGNPSLYLRVYVTHLRRKLERNPPEPRIILTESGFGYRLRGAKVRAD